MSEHTRRRHRERDGQLDASETADETTAAPTTCPECDGALRREDTETVCEACGLVADEHRIDHGPDWGPEETPRAKAGTVTRHDRGVGSTVFGHVDAQGRSVESAQLGRMRRWQSRATFRSTAERNQAHGLTEIARLVAALDCGWDVREQASRLFQQAQDADLLKGRSIESVAAASVLAVCRLNQRPITRGDVAAYAQVPASKITMAFDVLNRELGLPVPPRAPVEYVPRLVGALDLPIPDDSVRRRAERLAAAAAEHGVVNGVKPSGFAAACVYVACDEHGLASVLVTQQDLADAADCTPVTLRSHMHRIRDAGIPALADE